MTGLEFYIVDVFAEHKYAGNQLAVFRNASQLTSEEMQAIAREMHFSETTFVLSDEPRNGGYDVRIFTPGEEVPFAGHPTLGTAYVIQQKLADKPVREITLNLGVGPIPVTFRGLPHKVTLWMKQIEPEVGKTLQPSSLAPVLSLDERDIDTRFPIQEISTGLPHIIVPLKHLDALKRVSIDNQAYQALVRDAWAKAILVFCPRAYVNEHDLAVRVFPVYYGIPEDPATGSGNGCLAGYLVHNNYFGHDEIDLRVDQGYEIDRPSLLRLKAQRTDTGIDVQIGGRVIEIARGELLP